MLALICRFSIIKDALRYDAECGGDGDPDDKAALKVFPSDLGYEKTDICGGEQREKKTATAEWNAITP